MQKNNYTIDEVKKANYVKEEVLDEVIVKLVAAGFNTDNLRLIGIVNLQSSDGPITTSRKDMDIVIPSVIKYNTNISISDVKHQIIFKAVSKDKLDDGILKNYTLPDHDPMLIFISIDNESIASNEVIDSLIITNTDSFDGDIELSGFLIPDDVNPILFDFIVKNNAHINDTYNISLTNSVKATNALALLLSNRENIDGIEYEYDNDYILDYIVIERKDDETISIELHSDRILSELHKAVSALSLSIPAKFIAQFEYIDNIMSMSADDKKQSMLNAKLRNNILLDYLADLNRKSQLIGLDAAIAPEMSLHTQRFALAQQLIDVGREVSILTDDGEVPIKREIMTPILREEVLELLAIEEMSKESNAIYYLLSPVGMVDLIVLFTSETDFDDASVDKLKLDLDAILAIDNVDLDKEIIKSYLRILNDPMPMSRVAMLLTPSYDS